MILSEKSCRWQLFSLNIIYFYLFREFEFILDLLSDLDLLIHTLFHISFRFLGSAVPFLSVSTV